MIAEDTARLAGARRGRFVGTGAPAEKENDLPMPGERAGQG